MKTRAAISADAIKAVSHLLPSSVLKKGLPAVASALRGHPQLITPFVQAMLQLPKAREDATPGSEVQRARCNVTDLSALANDVNQALDWSLWILCGGDPGPSLKSAVGDCSGGVCGLVWGKNEIAYRCSTCSLDSTCAICVACFLDGNHEGHDYAMIHTGGGCCDCGDPTAWKVDGFCTKHNGPHSTPPLPAPFVATAQPTLAGVLQVWEEWVEELAPSGNQKPHKPDWHVAVVYSQACSEWLLRLCSQGDSLLKLVARCFCDGRQKLMKGLMENMSNLPPNQSSSVTSLFFKLLGDPDFKYQFAIIFVHLYPSLLHSLLKEQEQEGQSRDLDDMMLDNFSVQLFTVPTLTPRLVKEAGLLDILLNTLCTLLSHGLGPDGRLKCEATVVAARHYYRVGLDLRYTLTHVEAARHATEVGSPYLDYWLRILSMVQGMNPQYRQIGYHVTYEDVRWTHAFFLVGHLVVIHRLFVAGICSPREDTWAGEPTEAQGQGQDALMDTGGDLPVGSDAEEASGSRHADGKRTDGDGGDDDEGDEDDILPRAHRLANAMKTCFMALMQVCAKDASWEMEKKVSSRLSRETSGREQSGVDAPETTTHLFDDDFGNAVDSGAEQIVRGELMTLRVGVSRGGSHGDARPAAATATGTAPDIVQGAQVMPSEDWGLDTAQLRRRLIRSRDGGPVDAREGVDGAAEEGRQHEGEPGALGRGSSGVTGRRAAGLGTASAQGSAAKVVDVGAGSQAHVTDAGGQSRLPPGAPSESTARDITQVAPGESPRLSPAVVGETVAVQSMPEPTAPSSEQLQATLMAWVSTPFDVSRERVSFHLPMHRLLALLLNVAARQAPDWGIPLRDLLPQGMMSRVGAAALLECPLRLAVLCAQVNAGMWRRNGMAIVEMLALYNSVDWCEGSLELDLFVTQWCAVVLPPDQFVRQVVQRFGLASFFTMGGSKYAEGYEPVLAEEMLSLLLRVTGERMFCGLDARAAIRRELVQWLAVNDARHSRLHNALPRRLAEETELVAECLEDVAVYRMPSGTDMGRYTLRPEAWSDLDLYYPRWNKSDLQHAVHRYEGIFRKSALVQQLPRWREPYSGFQDLYRILHTPQVATMLRSIIHQSILGTGRATDSLVIVALHLLALAISTAELMAKADAERDKAPSSSAATGGSGNGRRTLTILDMAQDTVLVVEEHEDGGRSCGDVAKAGEEDAAKHGKGKLRPHSLVTLLLEMRRQLAKSWRGSSSTPSRDAADGGPTVPQATGNELELLVRKVLDMLCSRSPACATIVRQHEQHQARGAAASQGGLGTAAASAGQAGQEGAVDVGAAGRNTASLPSNAAQDAKAQQEAAMAEMRARQAKFMAAFADMEDDDEEEDEGRATKTDDAGPDDKSPEKGGARTEAAGSLTTPSGREAKLGARQSTPATAALSVAPPEDYLGEEFQGEVCAFCHNGTGSRPLCYIALGQRSKTVYLADRKVPTWDPSSVGMAAEGGGASSRGGQQKAGPGGASQPPVAWGGGGVVVADGGVVLDSDDEDELMMMGRRGIVEDDYMDGQAGAAPMVNVGAFAGAWMEGALFGPVGETPTAFWDGALDDDADEDDDDEDEQEEEDEEEEEEEEDMEEDEEQGVVFSDDDIPSLVETDESSSDGDGGEGDGSAGADIYPGLRSLGEALSLAARRAGGADGPAGDGRQTGARMEITLATVVQHGEAPGGTGLVAPTTAPAVERQPAPAAVYFTDGSGEGAGGGHGTGRGAPGGQPNAGGTRGPRGSWPGDPHGPHGPHDPATRHERVNTLLEDVGVQVVSCGHKCHVDCMDRYFTSLVQRHNQREIYQGANVNNLEAGEFLCPLCRRIANCLLPAIPETVARRFVGAPASSTPPGGCPQPPKPPAEHNFLAQIRDDTGAPADDSRGDHGMEPAGDHGEGGVHASGNSGQSVLTACVQGDPHAQKICRAEAALQALLSQGPSPNTASASSLPAGATSSIAATQSGSSSGAPLIPDALRSSLEALTGGLEYLWRDLGVEHSVQPAPPGNWRRMEQDASAEDRPGAPPSLSWTHSMHSAQCTSDVLVLVETLACTVAAAEVGSRPTSYAALGGPTAGVSVGVAGNAVAKAGSGSEEDTESQHVLASIMRASGGASQERMVGPLLVHLARITGMSRNAWLSRQLKEAEKQATSLAHLPESPHDQVFRELLLSLLPPVTAGNSDLLPSLTAEQAVGLTAPAAAAINDADAAHAGKHAGTGNAGTGTPAAQPVAVNAGDLGRGSDGSAGAADEDDEMIEEVTRASGQEAHSGSGTADTCWALAESLEAATEPVLCQDIFRVFARTVLCWPLHGAAMDASIFDDLLALFYSMAVLQAMISCALDSGSKGLRKRAAPKNGTPKSHRRDTPCKRMASNGGIPAQRAGLAQSPENPPPPHSLRAGSSLPSSSLSGQGRAGPSGRNPSSTDSDHAGDASSGSPTQHPPWGLSLASSRGASSRLVGGVDAVRCWMHRSASLAPSRHACAAIHPIAAGESAAPGTPTLSSSLPCVEPMCVVSALVAKSLLASAALASSNAATVADASDSSPMDTGADSRLAAAPRRSHPLRPSHLAPHDAPPPDLRALALSVAGRQEGGGDSSNATHQAVHATAQPELVGSPMCVSPPSETVPDTSNGGAPAAPRQVATHAGPTTALTSTASSKPGGMTAGGAHAISSIAAPAGRCLGSGPPPPIPALVHDTLVSLCLSFLRQAAILRYSLFPANTVARVTDAMAATVGGGASSAASSSGLTSATGQEGHGSPMRPPVSLSVPVDKGKRVMREEDEEDANRAGANPSLASVNAERAMLAEWQLLLRALDLPTIPSLLALSRCHCPAADAAEREAPQVPGGGQGTQVSPLRLMRLMTRWCDDVLGTMGEPLSTTLIRSSAVVPVMADANVPTLLEDNCLDALGRSAGEAQGIADVRNEGVGSQMGPGPGGMLSTGNVGTLTDARGFGPRGMRACRPRPVLQRAAGAGPLVPYVRRPHRVSPVQLLQLPFCFHDLFQLYVSRRCHNCQTVPERPALCLLCGTLVCANTKCCAAPPSARYPGRHRLHAGECFQHAHHCGARLGVFLLLKTTGVLLLRCERTCLWPSPYLDAHGEEDVDLKRGKPLYLNAERYEALTAMVAKGSMEHNGVVLARTVRRDGIFY